MRKDHYLPASVIGRFSVDNSTAARQRRVYVAYRGKNAAFLTRAENVGYVNDLYKLPYALFPNSDETSIDTSINGYEPALPNALDQLELAAPIGALTWLRVLVPYVASLFVRGNDFIPRYMTRQSVAGPLNTTDNANACRVIELERLLAPVCCARWVVLHKEGGEPFILNDLGLTATTDIVSGENGWAIPIGTDSVLGIFPQPKRVVLGYFGGEWRALIEHRLLDPFEARGFNNAAAHLGTAFVVGSESAVVERVAALIARGSNANGLMDAWPFDHRTKLAHAQDWHRLVSAVATNPDPPDISDVNSVNPLALAADWCPPVGVILNLQRHFPSGLTLQGNLIGLSLDMPSNYRGHFLDSAKRRSAS